MYNFEPLTAFLNSEAKNYKIPAVDMLIMKNGEYVYRHMAGYSDPDKKKPVSEKDLYWIYSASKISHSLSMASCSIWSTTSHPP